MSFRCQKRRVKSNMFVGSRVLLCRCCYTLKGQIVIQWIHQFQSVVPGCTVADSVMRYQRLLTRSEPTCPSGARAMDADTDDRPCPVTLTFGRRGPVNRCTLLRADTAMTKAQFQGTEPCDTSVMHDELGGRSLTRDCGSAA